MSTLDDIYEEINIAESIVILTHEHPDGDAIGTALALSNALKMHGKSADVIIPEYSRCFENVPGIKDVLKEGKDEYALAIAVDLASLGQLGDCVKYFENAKKTICIDHHSSNNMMGDINFVDPFSPAAAQVLYGIFKAYNWEITEEIGADLMTGIITDTGGFQYQSVSKETFEIAAEMRELGVDIPQIYKDTLATHTITSFKLKRIAYDRLEFFEDGKITFTYINKKDEEKVNAETGDYEGIVNEGRNLEGVEVSVFLRQTDTGYKASLRSNSYVNVSEICGKFGGGGHIRAAGAKFTEGKPEEIKEQLVAEIKKYLK